MAFEAAELKARITLDTRDLDRGLRDADAKLRQFGTRASGAGKTAAGSMDGLSGALKGVSGALQAVGVAVSLASIARLGADAITAANNLEKTEATVKALSGSTDRYAQVLAVATAGQQRYGGSLQENLGSLGRLVNLSNRTGVELTKLDNLMRRLATVDPLQGVEGAGYALKEMFSNQGATATLSLRNRFELDRSVLKTIEDASATAEEKVLALDSALNQLGITNEVLTNSTETTAASYDRLGAAASNLQTLIGSGLASAFEQQAVGLTRVIGLLTNNAAAYEQLDAVVVGVLNRIGLATDEAGDSAGRASAQIAGAEAAQRTYNAAIAAGQPEFIAAAMAIDAAAVAIGQHAISSDQAAAAGTNQAAVSADQAAAAAEAKARTEELAAALQLVSANGPAAQSGLIVAAAGADAVRIAAAEARAEVGSLLDLMANVGRTSMPGASIGGTNRAAGGRTGGIFAGSAGSAAAAAAAAQSRTGRVLANVRANAAPARTGGGGGSSRVSEAEKTAEKLLEIEERTAERLREIDERVAADRIAAQRRLSAELITSANDFAVNAQSNDLDLIGATGKDAERLQDREKAEAQARIGYVKAIAEAKEVAAQGDADLARDTYEVRQDQVRQQQELDEAYYARARELPAEQQEALKKEYDEATAAIATSAADRISLAQAEAQARAQAIETEKSAAVQAGQEQADALKKTGESATTAKGQVNDLGTSLRSLPTNVTTTVTVRTVNEGGGKAAGDAEPASGGGGGSKPGKGGAVSAAGGAHFVTRGPTSLTVGDNPGGRELVTVTPLSGKGQTRYSGNAIALAGGGSVDASADTATERVNQGSTPDTGAAATKPRRGRSIADMDRDWAAAQAKIRKLEEQYLFTRERMNEDHFWKQTRSDLALMQAERTVKRTWEEQQAEIDRAQDAREQELLKQLQDRQTAEQTRQVANAEQSVSEARNRALSEAGRRYASQGAAIAAEGAQARNDVESFWQTVRLADTSAAFQEERLRINESYDRQREETVQRVQDTAEEVSQEAEDAARLQAEREFQARRDALEDQQFIDQAIFERGWDKWSDTTKKSLDKELELYQAFWKQAFELIPGGADAWSNLQKRETGGPVTRGQPYIVGERRPEVFVPGQNGYILPDVGGAGVMITIPIDLRGATGITPAHVKAIEEAGYRGAKKALAESGGKAASSLRTGGRRG